MAEDQYLVTAVKRSGRFVEFAGQGSFGIRAETTSNSHLPKSELLDRRQLEALETIGWLAPTGSPEEATPEQQPDGSPNYSRLSPAGCLRAFENVAKLVVQTFAEVVLVPHPGFLEYEAFDDDRPIAFPELGLKVCKPPQAEADADTVRQAEFGGQTTFSEEAQRILKH